MNKRILSILLGLALVVGLLVLAVPVSAAPDGGSLTITADKTEANPGDTVNFTVTLGAVQNVASVEFTVDVPAGLTFVSSTTTPNLATTLGFGGAQFNGKKFVGYAGDNVTINSDTVLGTITCTVDSDASGTYDVGFTSGIVFCDVDEEDVSLSTTAASVTVSSETPATEAPATEAPATEAPATEAPATEAPATEAPATEAPATEAPHVCTEGNFVPQVDPDPVNQIDGVKEHYECKDCGKKYKDATCLEPVTDEDLRIPWNAPATEAPATEAPATEAPATEAPATEAPATEAPATEAPATEAPATEAPDETVAPDETEAPAATEPATGDEATKDESTKDTATKDNSTTSPKTGDSTHMYLWMLIMLASLAGVGVVLYTAKRKGIFTK